MFDNYSCHLALGESRAALMAFKECLKSAKDGSTSDLKIAEEALDGIRKCEVFRETFSFNF